MSSERAKSMSNERWQHLQVPVHTVDKDLDEAFAIFQRKEFQGIPKTWRDRTLKYIVYLYDKNSDLIHEYPDLTERKRAAATEAGWDFLNAEKNKFNIKVERIMELRDERTRAAVLKYLELQNSKEMDMIHYNEQLFAEYRDLLLRPVLDEPTSKEDALGTTDVKNIYATADYKKKLREECKQIASDLEKLYAKVYGDNEDLNQGKEVVFLP